MPQGGSAIFPPTNERAFISRIGIQSRDDPALRAVHMGNIGWDNSMTEIDGPSLGGFGFAIRTFWLKGSDLILRRGWEREPDSAQEMASRMYAWIAGKGLCEKDQVCVIGSEDKINELHLTIRPDDRSLDRP